MAVKHWHPGKLVILWAVFAIPAWLLISDAMRPRLYITGGLPFQIAEQEAQRARDATEARIKLLAGVLLGVVPLATTWVWLSARDRKRSPS